MVRIVTTVSLAAPTTPALRGNGSGLAVLRVDDRYFVGSHNGTSFASFLKIRPWWRRRAQIQVETPSRERLVELWDDGLLIVNDRDAYRKFLRETEVTEGEDQVQRGFERGRAVWAGLLETDDVRAARELLESSHFHTLVRGENTTIRIQRILDVFRERYPYYRDKCEHCGAEGTSFVGDVKATKREFQQQRAFRAELRYCDQCHRTTRFVRANAVRRILKNRRGRCGEYSAAFAAVLLALNLECRWIYDSTDHVWNEVFIDGQWRHVDPCEAALDIPLLYSNHWGKSGCIVLGFNRDNEVIDLTPKYYPVVDIDALRHEMDLDDITMARLLKQFSS